MLSLVILADVLSSTRTLGSPREDVEAALARAFARALAEHEELASIEGADFAAHVAACLPEGPVTAGAIDALAAPDLLLALACSRGDAAALSIFEARYLANVGAYVARLSLSPSVVDELTQVLRERLLVGAPPRIAAYGGAGPLEGWLRAAALRTALNLKRSTRREVHSDDDDRAIAAAGSDPELAYLKQRYRVAFEQAFDAAMRSLEASSRTLLRLHYIDRLTLPQVAELSKTSRATVARRLAEARDALLTATRRELGERTGASPTEIESLLALVRSEMGIRLSALG